MTTERTGAWVETYTGQQYWPMDPRPEDVDIRDVAHALAMICRFNGHVTRFYSVAEHSYRVSYAAERAAIEAGLPEEQVTVTAQWGLLHDASEAYLGDMVRPLKILGAFDVYREAEKRNMGAILQRFDLPLVEPSHVTVADDRMLATEREQIMRGDRGGPTTHDWHGALPYEDKAFSHYVPSVARKRFMKRFNELQRRRR
jgi:hypothetical protein